MLKVYKTCCQNCLLSADRIVSPTRAKQIINDCAKEQTHFICHKASEDGKDIVCNTFYKTLGHKSQMIRIAERLNMVEFIEQPKAEKLLTHTQMKNGRRRIKLNTKLK